MNVKCFGLAKDIIHTDLLDISEYKILTVAELRIFINEKYPQFAKIKSYMVAVNKSYATDATVLRTNDEIAIIPPVSGG